MHRNSSKRRTNIDQLLRDGLSLRTTENGEKRKSATEQIEKALRVQSSNFRNHRIDFCQATENLRASELIDFFGVQMLNGLDAFAGTTSGVLKGLNLNKQSFVNYRTAPKQEANSEQTPQQHEPVVHGGNGGEAAAATTVEGGDGASSLTISPIMAMNFTQKDQCEVLMGRKDGQVDLFNTLTETMNSLFRLPGGDCIRGIHSVGSDRILTATSSGALAIWDALGKRLTKEEWTTGGGGELLTMRLAPCADDEATTATANVFATGGRENPLKLWDMAEEKNLFTAKNVRPDSLELRVPIWVTNCRFLNMDERKLVTSTGNAQIRLYDVRAQRRPVLQESWLEEPIQALSTCSREWHVLAGNNRGELGLFDLRSTGKTRLACKYKGFAGAIRHIDASPTEPQLLSCGADRFAILHNLDSRAIVHKIYCKVQLNCCLLRSGSQLPVPLNGSPNQLQQQKLLLSTNGRKRK